MYCHWSVSRLRGADTRDRLGPRTRTDVDVPGSAAWDRLPDDVRKSNHNPVGPGSSGHNNPVGSNCRDHKLDNVEVGAGGGAGGGAEVASTG